GSGGTVMLVANGSGTSGRIDVEQRVDVTGGAGGGTINSMSSGDTILGTTPSGGPLLAADANGDGSDGGEIDVAAGGQVRGNNGATGPLRARGSTGFFPGDPAGFGGTFCIDATGSLPLGGSSGGLDASASALRADGPDRAIALCAGRDVVLGSPLVSAAATSILSGDEGGSLCVASGRNIKANGPVNVSASGPNAGGMIDVEACRDLSIGGAATLNADGGQGGGSGGAIFLL